jgi:hypothetical protein
MDWLTLGQIDAASDSTRLAPTLIGQNRPVGSDPDAIASSAAVQQQHGQQLPKTTPD